MRAVLIHQAFVAPDEAGGTRHYELAKRAVESGIEFTIVASDISYLTGQRAITGETKISEQQFDGVRVLRAYTYPSLHRSFAWRVVSFLSFMLSSLRAAWRAGRVDLVMGTSPPIFQALSVDLKCRTATTGFITVFAPDDHRVLTESSALNIEANGWRAHVEFAAQANERLITLVAIGGVIKDRLEVP